MTWWPFSEGSPRLEWPWLRAKSDHRDRTARSGTRSGQQIDDNEGALRTVTQVQDTKADTVPGGQQSPPPPPPPSSGLVTLTANNQPARSLFLKQLVQVEIVVLVVLAAIFRPDELAVLPTKLTARISVTDAASTNSGGTCNAGRASS